MENTKSKEVLIINEYQYTDVLMEEVQNAQAAAACKNCIPLVIIGLVCAFFTRRELILHKTVFAVLFAIIGIGCIIAIAAVLVSTVKKKSAAVRQFHDTYHGKGFAYRIYIEGNHIRSYENGAKGVNMRKSDIRGTLESERFFIFQLSGELLLPLKKDAFTEGNVEMCRNYIPKVRR